MDYTPLITSEHATKPNFVAMVALTANAVGDITALLDSMPGLFDFNVAIGDQLDTDGQWIGLSRVVTGIPLGNFYGFADDPSALPFGDLNIPPAGGRYIELNESATQNATLGDPDYRSLLAAQIVKNDYDGNIMDYETALADLVNVPCLTYDPGTLVVMIVLTQVTDVVTAALLTSYDILPRPGGVQYRPVFVLTPLNWSVVGTAAVSGPNIIKPSGASAWDSSAFIAAPFSRIWMTWAVPDTTHTMMGGLSSNPSGSPNFPSLNFGLQTAAGGVVSISEAGTSRGNFGTYVGGDTFTVYYDGKEAVYWHNNRLLRVAPSAVGSLSPMVCLFSPGAQAQNILVNTG